VTEAKTWDTDGRVTKVERTGNDSGTSITESYEYSYNNGGDENGLLANVKLRRIVGSDDKVIRQVYYTYYTGNETASERHGNAGNLKTVTIKDGETTPNALETQHYRWWRPDDTDFATRGFLGGLKNVLLDESYARAKGANVTPESATTSQIEVYADFSFEYDSARRVSKEVVQGAGCSCSGSGGRSTFTYTYSTSPHGAGYNSWKHKTIEKQLNDTGSTLYENIVYTNYYGQVMMTRFRNPDGTLEWRDYWRYEQEATKAKGSVALHALPSAVSGYDESKADLVDLQGSHYTHIRDTEGLVEKASYHTSGPEQGFYYKSFVQRGDGGSGGSTSPITRHKLTYTSHTGGPITVVVPQSEVLYRNETEATGYQTTGYEFHFYTGTVQPDWVEVTLPIVDSTQNGPGDTGNKFKVELDAYGRPTKFIEDSATGGLNIQHKVEYHEPTGAVKTIKIDEGTGRLNLTTSYINDRLGRPTEITDPNGNLTYIVYRDPQHEVRVYPGWQGSPTHRPTGPTYVYRENWPTSGPSQLVYYEALTMSAPPALDASNKPTGTESISTTM
jgi:hypothetical protein